MIPATGPFDSALVRETFGLGTSFTSAQLATAAGLSAAFTSDNLRGRSGNAATTLTINTNDPSGTAFTRHQVTGYSGNRSLRVERYSFTGDTTFAELKINVYTSTTKDGTYTLRGSINPYGTGMAYLDFTLATNSWIKYEVVASTGQGRKAAQWEMVIWDLTAGVRISTGKWCYITVDADNNYVPVATIDGYIYEGFQGSDGWDDWYGNYGTFTIKNASPTAYMWSISGDTGRLFIQGSPTNATMTISSDRWYYNEGQTRTVNVNCRVTIGGVQHNVTKAFQYYG